MTDWHWLTFDQLGSADLYAALALRQDVFILEQTCLFPDIDGLDPSALHLLGWHTVDGQRRLVAYLRCLAPGAKYPEMSLGRIVTAPAARGTGIGRELVAQGIAHATAQFPGHAIRIGAQARLERFYQHYGFVTVTAMYVEDGIDHVDMVRS